jgi:uncharacterized membrane protein YeaQ/YmgE (transglycosylase-associated protein family)
MMGLIWTIVIGFVVGALAKFILPGKDPGGWIITTLLGIGGALVAKYGGQAIGWYHEGHPAGFIGSLVGAIILLLIYRLVKRPAAGTGGKA